MIVEKKNFRNWHSTPQSATDLTVTAGIMRPTGEGKECVAQKRREELAEAARDLAAKVAR